jgi:glycosyltransferase involved in cell wall biosynthesis
MSMNITYLAPQLQPLNGISQYATLLQTAMKKYAPQVSLHRVDEMAFEQHYPALPKASVIMAEMGTGEGKVFQVLRKQKEHRPDLKRLITIHDPPRFAVEPTPFLEKMACSLPTRLIRRIFLDKLGWIIERQMVQPHDVVLCLTPRGKKVLEEKFKRFFPAPPKVCYVPHLLYADPPEQAAVPEHAEPRLGYFGYINPHKGLHILIEAAHCLRKAHQPMPTLIIYGEPITAKGSAYLKRMYRLVHKYRLEDKVQFKGYISNEDLPAFLRSIDALAIPYLDLGFASASGVLQWARSFGVPVLASQTPTLSSLIADGIEGRVISTSNIHEWAEAISSIATQRKKWNTFREGMVSRRTEAEWKSVVQRLVEILEMLQRS